MIRKLFDTPHGRTYHNMYSDKIIVDFIGRSSLVDFVLFKEMVDKVRQINVPDLLISDDYSSDLQLIDCSGCNRCFILNISEVIKFTELLDGTKAILDLEDILIERLVNNVLA